MTRRSSRASSDASDEQRPAAKANPISQRVKLWVLCVAMFVGGIGATWLSLTGCLGTLHDLKHHAPLVVWSSIDMRGLFAGIALLALAPICVPVRATIAPAPRRHRRAPQQRFDVPALLVGVALLCLLLCMIAPAVVTIVIAEAAARRGYHLCPSPNDEHRPPLRWARVSPPQRCPASWRDAERIAG